ncbi:hypothetical protein LX32DRAFT_645673 [Colletotrichum zoysiae]|uniref:Uncharacterized protein n=1 Tax=Colletotrichum zoysiae TaxID=1216348 RepID=A0AAD9H4E8_9PEZI|nr:hypothetical protein LX32DRAFT_645673 [Colletotrichum zoysiae]
MEGAARLDSLDGEGDDRSKCKRANDHLTGMRANVVVVVVVVGQRLLLARRRRRPRPRPRRR